MNEEYAERLANLLFDCDCTDEELEEKIHELRQNRDADYERD